ncbi:MAG: 16S rRNA (guanine(966)-N(2))-methyltransferase RsmD [Chloroflexi bacterium]|nr:16S rRNA (guanine(966)-N(2))-methyltransferase RsmD [Chloroflexota bacterium]MCL5274724.1 16S rRNA (guanine(966)-N(2))-methyltransferase RsmD [Chloroflexota bacterium]
MRITTGRAKGRKLRTVPGDVTRPITDRVKQAVFNILGDDVIDSAWLDMFAGTGAVGIEALSRGARSVTFIDQNALAIRTIEVNLKTAQLAQNAHVIRQDAFKYIAGYPNTTYDFIYVAPPQYKGLWAQAVTLIDNTPTWLADGGAVIVQIHPREFHELDIVHLELVDQRRYGATLLCFYEHKTEGNEPETG